MNNMGGDEDVDLPEVDGADDVSLQILFSVYLNSKKQCIYRLFSIDSRLLFFFATYCWFFP